MHGGGHMIVNNPDLIEPMMKAEMDFRVKSIAFHDKLMSLGVKAYRCNDGWVNREKNTVTFFSHEDSKGWYYGVNRLQFGDKIFIGNMDDKGYFAIVDEVVSESHLPSGDVYEYHFYRIEEPKSESKGFWAWIKKIFKR